VQRLSGALRFAKICDSGFLRNALGHACGPEGSIHRDRSTRYAPLRQLAKRCGSAPASCRNGRGARRKAREDAVWLSINPACSIIPKAGKQTSDSNSNALVLLVKIVQSGFHAPATPTDRRLVYPSFPACRPATKNQFANSHFCVHNFRHVVATAHDGQPRQAYGIRPVRIACGAGGGGVFACFQCHCPE